MDARFEGRPAGGDALIATCIHEAGHCVVAHRLRFRVIEAVVHATGGHVKYENTRRSQLVNRIIVTTAGHAAQARLDPAHHSPVDRANARENAFLLSSSKRGERHLLRWAKAEAEALVKREWPLICIVADRLQKHGRLSGRAVSRIVRSYDADKRAEIEKYLKAYPNWQEILKARKKRLLRGRKPRRHDVARAAVEAMSAKRFIPSPLYSAITDRMVARGFGEREAVECLDEHDIFPETPP